MKPNFHLTFLYVFILAALLVPLEAYSEDECEVEIKVHRKAQYTALLGEDLKIRCPVKFCNDSPPTVSWFKLEETDVPVNNNHGSRFRTEWKTLKHLEGESVLIIQNVVRNDSGVYQCQSGSSVGHKIYVFANDDGRTSSTTEKHNITDGRTGNTSVNGSPETGEPLWPTVYRVVGVMGLVIIVIIVYVTSDSIHKCVRGCSKETPDPSSQPSTKAEPMDHDYEDVQ